MLDSSEIKTAIDTHKHIFDYATMLLTCYAWFGIVIFLLRSWRTVDPLTAVAFYPATLTAVAFAIYLLIRMFSLNDSLAKALGKKAEGRNALIFLVTVVVSFAQIWLLLAIAAAAETFLRS